MKTGKQLSTPKPPDSERFETLTVCPYCQSENIQLLFTSPDRLTKRPGIFYLSECKNCRLVFQNPRLREKHIGEFYNENITYFKPPQEEPIIKKSLRKKLGAWAYKQTLINHFGYTHLGQTNALIATATSPLRRYLNIDLIPDFIDEGSVYEVGCSHGGRLESLKKLGWKHLSGLELDKDAAQYAKEKRGFNVVQNRMEDVHFSEKSFDTVIMSMVLEHIYNPFEQIKKITGWLRPGGQLLFSIPYFRGIEFKIFKNYSYGLQLPTHVTFFDKKILKKILQELGYEDIQFFWQPTIRDLTSGFDYMFQEKNKKIFHWLAYNRLLRLIYKPIFFILSYLGLTSRLSVTARKIKKLS